MKIELDIPEEAVDSLLVRLAGLAYEEDAVWADALAVSVALLRRGRRNPIAGIHTTRKEAVKILVDKQPGT